MMDNLPQLAVYAGQKQTFGQLGNPAHVIHVPGRAAAKEGVYWVNYSLNGSRPMPLQLGPSAFRLKEPGEFNVELPRRVLTPGDNELVLRVCDRAGLEVGAKLEVKYEAHKVWPLPYEIDWSQVDRLTHVAEVVDGRWAVDTAGLRTAQIGYDRSVAIGDVAWSDYEACVHMTFHGFERTPLSFCWPSDGPWFGMKLRWQGYSDWGDVRPARGWHPIGAVAQLHQTPDLAADQARLRVRAGAGRDSEQEATPRPLEPGRTYVYRFAVQSRPDQTSTYRLKVWPADEAEPDDWHLTAEGDPDELATGSLLLVAHYADVTIGSVHITPLT